MKAENSKRFELDARNLYHVFGAAMVGILSIYTSNTEAFNSLLARHIDPETFIVISLTLAYLAKKFLTNYSEK